MIENRNGNNPDVHVFDMSIDGLIVDLLEGAPRVHYSIKDFSPEFRERFLNSARYVVAGIRKSWYKVGNEADVVDACIHLLLTWGSVAQDLGFHLGASAVLKEPKRFILKEEYEKLKNAKE